MGRNFECFFNLWHAQAFENALLTFITMNHRCIHIFTTHICIPNRNFITEIYWLNVENRSKLMVI